MSSNNTKITARERARQARAAELKRQADALAAVETFFKATDSLAEIQVAYEKELEALEKRYATKREGPEAKAAKAVALLNESGDNKPSIAAQLGITVPEVSSWIDRAGLLAATAEPSASAATSGAGKKAGTGSASGVGGGGGGEASAGDAEVPAEAPGPQDNDSSEMEQRASA